MDKLRTSVFCKGSLKFANFYVLFLGPYDECLYENQNASHSWTLSPQDTERSHFWSKLMLMFWCYDLYILTDAWFFVIQDVKNSSQMVVAGSASHTIIGWRESQEGFEQYKSNMSLIADVSLIAWQYQSCHNFHSPLSTRDEWKFLHHNRKGIGKRDCCLHRYFFSFLSCDYVNTGFMRMLSTAHSLILHIH